MLVMDCQIDVKMYYDEYEKYFGDGFYPLLQKEKQDNTQIIISFEYKNNCWIQKSHDEINGLDGEIGKQLLEQLNREGNKEGKIIKNSYGFKIYVRD
jgi:hypothetical protein